MTASKHKDAGLSPKGFALAEILIVVVLAGALLGLSVAVHALQPDGLEPVHGRGRRPSAPVEAISIHGFSVSCARNTVLLRELHGTSRLCDLATGRDVPFALPFDNVTAVAQSQDGTVLAVGCRDGMLAIGREQSIATVIADENAAAVTALRCSPDGALIVAVDESGGIRALNPDGAPRWQRQAHSGRAERVAMAPDAEMIASTGGNGEIRLWEATSGRCLQTLTGHSWKVTCMAFAEGGRVLVSGSLDRTIRVWDVRTGRTLWTSPRQEGPVLSLACAPDRPVLAACASYQGRLRLWSLQTFRPIGELRGHTQGVRCLEFSPDGKRLFSAGYEGRLRTWPISSNSL